MESGIVKQELSFIYGDLEGEKLIDITEEDDDLLINSDYFDSLEDQYIRLSARYDNPNKHEGFKSPESQPSQEIESTPLEKLQQEGQKLSCHDFVPARPSYLRQSLAWDSAFFTSAGILDGDELTFINEGFRTAEMQRPPDTASRKTKIGIQNKIKSSALEGRNVNTQRSVKNKAEHMSKGEETPSLPLKAPKVLRRMTNALMGQSKSAKVENVAAKTSSGSRNSTVSDSTSTSDAAVRYLSKSKGLRNCRLSTQSLSLSNNFSSVSPAGSSFGMSSSGPGSRTKQKSNDTEVHFDTPVTLTRTNTQDEVNPSPHLTNNLHRKFTACLLNKQTNSLVLQSKQGSADASHVPTESRKKLKPSYLRMPSPKIGFFDEQKSLIPTVGQGLQFHFEMQCTPPTKSGPTSRKTPDKPLKARTSSETRCMKHGSQSTNPVKDKKRRDVSSDGKLKSCSPQGWSTMKSGSDSSLRFQSGTCGETEEKFCSKCRKVHSGKCEQKRVGHTDERTRVKGRLNSRLSRDAMVQRTDPVLQPQPSAPVKKEKNSRKQHNANNSHSSVEDKAKTLANLKDQVNDLSRYFEVIDLSREMLTDQKEHDNGCPVSQVDNNISKLNGDNNVIMAHGQKQDMLPNTVPGSSPLSSSRTPLADKTSISNATGLFTQSTTIEKLAEKPSKSPAPEGLPNYKENTLALYEL
nr:uncharacterized protein LOC113710668 [Coffea arabica]